MNREPVMIAAAVRAVLLAAISFGLDLTTEQIAATMVAVEAVLAVITRSQVAPVMRPMVHTVPPAEGR